MNFLFNDLSTAVSMGKSATGHEKEVLSGFLASLKLISKTAAGDQPVYWSSDEGIFDQGHNFISGKSLQTLASLAESREIKVALLSFQSRLKVLDCSRSNEYVEAGSSLRTKALHPYLRKITHDGCAISIFSNPCWGVGELTYQSVADKSVEVLPNVPMLASDELSKLLLNVVPFFSCVGKLSNDGENSVLPKLSISDAFLDNECLRELYKRASRNKNERLAAYSLVGSAVAEINGYALDSAVSAKNGTAKKLRKIFFHKKRGRYLSIDFEKRAFEFLGRKGEHLGEYSYSGLKLSGADGSGKHDIAI